MMPIDRRGLLKRFVGGAAWSAAASLGLPRLAFARAPSSRRFVVVVLRGALDGLAAAPPVGDPHYDAVRGELALSRGDGPEPSRLDGTFALHPALTRLKAIYDAGELALVHAVAIPVRERSHFAAQAALETGLDRIGESTGWLNRALAALGAAAVGRAVAIGEGVPLLLAGPAPAGSVAPSALPRPDPDYWERLSGLYAGDQVLSKALDEGLRVRRMAADAESDGPSMASRGRGPRAAFPPLARLAGRLLSAEDGPRVATLEAYGWDTHANQGAATGQLANRLAGLDDGLDALRAGLGPAWRETVIAVVTEFGRTVRPNGSRGTDHGTAGAAFLLGGAVRGGRVFGEWPGLSDPALFEGRDLAPATDMRGLLKGVLRDHMGLDAATLARDVFPGSNAVGPMDGLIRA